MSEPRFWSFLRSALRRKSMHWPPVHEARNAARTPYVGDNPRQKWSYECAECKGKFKGTEVEVDHVVDVGALLCFEDLPGFAARLFCEASGLRVVCKACHLAKKKKK